MTYLEKLNSGMMNTVESVFIEYDLAKENHPNLNIPAWLQKESNLDEAINTLTTKLNLQQNYDIAESIEKQHPINIYLSPYDAYVTEVKKKVVRLLKDKRKDSNITEKQMADFFGETVESYRKWENQEHDFTVEEIAAICDMCDKGFDIDFVDGDEYWSRGNLVDNLIEELGLEDDDEDDDDDWEVYEF